MALLDANAMTSLVGTATGWRAQDRDASQREDLHEMLLMADVISPWSVGRYNSLSGIDNWPFFLVFAFFRLAAILAGVAARAAAGNASNPEMARKYGAAVPVLAGMAVAITRDGAGD